MTLYKDVMEGNLARRKEKEAAAAAAKAAKMKAERDAYHAALDAEYERLPSRIDSLKEELKSMIVKWLEEEEAEPQDLEITPYTSDEFENSSDYYEYVQGYPALEDGCRLALEDGLGVYIKSLNPNLFGGIDGPLYFRLDVAGGSWQFPDFHWRYRGGDEDSNPLPTKECSNWDED